VRVAVGGGTMVRHAAGVRVALGVTEGVAVAGTGVRVAVTVAEYPIARSIAAVTVRPVLAAR